MTDFLFDGPADARSVLALAHGSGAPMDSPFLARVAAGLGAAGIRVARFEFPYMRARRQGGGARPPDRTPVLLDAWRQALAEIGKAVGGGPVGIGGKSLGGRMASLLADEVQARALVCLGYPFHPPGQPAKLRTEHLASLATPTLIVQGTRDPFGTREEVATYALAPAIRIAWLEGGDHSWKPPARSGRTEAQNLDAGIAAIADFLGAL